MYPSVLWFVVMLVLLILIPQGQGGRAAQAALPPRPTLTPTPTTASSASPLPSVTPRPTTAALPRLARIELQAPNFDGAWSVVQWQGEDGLWHDVAGWRGTINEGLRGWKVLPKDFGTGPFRWLVMDAPDGNVLATSAPFTLPTENGEQVNVPLP